MFYCLSCGLHFMVLMQSVNGAFRADRTVAAETKICKFLLSMIWARILQLILCFFGIRWVWGLWYWLRSMFWVIRWIIVLCFLIFSRIFDGLVWFSSWISTFLFKGSFNWIGIRWRYDGSCYLWFSSAFEMVVYFL